MFNVHFAALLCFQKTFAIEIDTSLTLLRLLLLLINNILLLLLFGR